MRENRLRTLVLLLNVIVAGVVVMVLELTGSRVITPIYGSSVMTWGGLIGTVLTCLSLGYAALGALADRTSPRKLLEALIVSASIYVLATPTLSAMLLSRLDPSILDDRIGTVLSSLIVLGPSTFLLGGVTPVALKLRASELASLGKVSGNLYAYSTLGSIIGTFLTTFVLIPMLDVNMIFYISGIALLIVVAPLIKSWKMLAALMLVVVFLYPQGVTFYLTCSSSLIGTLQYRGESLYNNIVVVDRGGIRYLYLNGLLHSGMSLADPYALVFDYTKLFAAGPLLAPNASRTLFIGGGGFSGPKFFLKNYRSMIIDVVEIDPAVVDVARDYFEVRDDPRLNVFVEDGRRYLTRTSEVYDVIIVDAYSKNYIPFHLMTLEFYALVKSHLKRNGIVILNIIASLEGPTSDIMRAEYKTIRSIFREVIVVPVFSSSGGQVQNIILIASDASLPLKDELIDLARMDNVSSSLGLDRFFGLMPTYELPIMDVPLLHDAYAPVENLLNPVTGTRLGKEYYLGVTGPSICG
ncbi:MAG: fused MFS/spermidine synthase [Nitrososphaerota archaeon]